MKNKLKLYVNGYNGDGSKVPCALVFTDDGVALTRPGQLGLVRPVRWSWDRVGSITIDGGMVSESKVGAIGALIAGGTANESTVTITFTDGGALYYSMPKATPQSVRARIAPHLKRAKVSLEVSS
jgi:hypothetical protein